MPGLVSPVGYKSYMTLQEHNAKIVRQITELAENDKPLFEAVGSITAMRNRRIFNDGKNSNGGKIGAYSTKRMLATQKQFLTKNSFKPTMVKQKNGKSRPLFLKFPNSKKAVPVMVLEGGYKEFRQLNGRPTNTVNLNLYGLVRSDFTTFQPVSKNKFISGPFRDENQKKLLGLQRKYGSPIALHTKEERAEMLRIMLEQTMKILRGNA